jgi:hypothetical protein
MDWMPFKRAERTPSAPNAVFIVCRISFAAATSGGSVNCVMIVPPPSVEDSDALTGVWGDGWC